MDSDQTIANASTKFDEAVNRFIEDLKAIRTGRANALMLDGVVVEVYGTTMPLNQVANVVAVDAQLLQVTPFDPNNLESIAEAIRNNSSLGLNPSDDGKVIRLPIPPLTEERRREMTKQINERIEDCMVKIRNIRHETIDAIDKLKKDKSIGEDEAKRQIKRLEELMADKRKVVDDNAKSKEQEILTL
ncbi:MAG TPA: ribosome recycling factor [Candidatus Saccharimonadales bacterium]|jgi:ribosome recycling factor